MAAGRPGDGRSALLRRLDREIARVARELEAFKRGDDHGLALQHAARAVAGVLPEDLLEQLRVEEERVDRLAAAVARALAASDQELQQRLSRERADREESEQIVMRVAEDVMGTIRRRIDRRAGRRRGRVTAESNESHLAQLQPLHGRTGHGTRRQGL